MTRERRFPKAARLGFRSALQQNGDEQHAEAFVPTWICPTGCATDSDVARRTKHSVSLSPELSVAIERAAAERGETFSGWLAATASHRLRLEAGRRGLAQWERVHGALTTAELEEGRARARALLGVRKSDRKRKSA